MKRVSLVVLIISGCSSFTNYTDYPTPPQPQRQEVIYSARQQCHDDERIAFAYVVLQTQLMEVALTCGQDDAYNRFVTRHQLELLDANQKLAGYFARRDYLTGPEQRDEYITELANAQSQRRSPEFCQSIASIVEQAETLTTAADVIQFVTQYHLINPDTSCPLRSDHFVTEDPANVAHNIMNRSLLGDYYSRSP